jgi:hypothetical protein
VPTKSLSEPWRSFLHDLDRELTGPTELHCFGGFVLAEHYHVTRATADIDVIQAVGTTDLRALSHLAGKGSVLAQRHRVYLDIVTVASVPEDYADRLIDMVPREFEHLRLRAFEANDLALAKLGRNSDRDREDVKRLAASGALDAQTMRHRYLRELRYQFGNPAREDLTLELWLQMFREIKGDS